MIISQLEEREQGRKEKEGETIPSRSMGLLLLCTTLSATGTLSTSLHTKKNQQYQKLPMAMSELNPACVGVTCFVIYCYDLAADLWFLARDSMRSHKKFFLFNSILLPSIAPPWMCCASL